MPFWHGVTRCTPPACSILAYTTHIHHTPHSINLPRPPKPLTPRIDIRRAIKQRLTGMSYKDIATSHGVTKQAVSQALKPIMEMVGDPDVVKAFQDNRADVMDGLSAQLARKLLDPAKIEKASINNLAYALRQLYDMGRLERDQSTANVAVVHEQANQTLAEVDAEIASITEELPDSAQSSASPDQYADDPKLTKIDAEIERLSAQGVDIDTDIVDVDTNEDG